MPCFFIKSLELGNLFVLYFTLLQADNLEMTPNYEIYLCSLHYSFNISTTHAYKFVKFIPLYLIHCTYYSHLTHLDTKNCAIEHDCASFTLQLFVKVRFDEEFMTVNLTEVKGRLNHLLELGKVQQQLLSTQ